MRVALPNLCLACLFAATPAFSGARDAEIEALVGKAVAEHSVMVNCDALSKQHQDADKEFWARNAEQSVIPALSRLDLAPDVLARLIQKVSPAGVEDRTKGTVGELIAYCSDNWELIRKIRKLEGVNLPVELEKMLKQ
jgi:hypothetical protein